MSQSQSLSNFSPIHQTSKFSKADSERSQPSLAETSLTELVGQLQLYIEFDSRRNKSEVPQHLVASLKRLLSRLDTNFVHNSTNSDRANPAFSHIPNHESASDDKIRDTIDKLHQDREALMLQVGVLTEQVEAQGEKIRELQSTSISQNSYHENSNTSSPSRDRLAKPNIDTDNLEFIAEISSLRLQLTLAEKEKIETQEKLQRAQEQLSRLHLQFSEKDYQIAELRAKLMRQQAHVLSHSQQSNNDLKIEKLKKIVESLMETTAHKDKRIEDLKNAIKRYRRIEELIFSAHDKDAINEVSGDDLNGSTKSVKSFSGLGHAELSAFTPAHKDKNMPFSTLKNGQSSASLLRAKTIAYDSSSLPASVRLHQRNFFPRDIDVDVGISQERRRSLKKRTRSGDIGASKFNHHDSKDLKSHLRNKTPPPANPKQQRHFGTVEIDSHSPSQSSSTSSAANVGKQVNSGSKTNSDENQSDAMDRSVNSATLPPLPASATNKKNRFFDRNKESSNSTNDDTTARNQSATVHLVVHDKNHSLSATGVTKDGTLERKKKGRLRFFSKMRLRRSNSQELETRSIQNLASAKENAVTENNHNATVSANTSTNNSPSLSIFKRGGFRSTAGPRISSTSSARLKNQPSHARSEPPIDRSVGLPTNGFSMVSNWDANQVGEWLTEMGLGSYSQNVYRAMYNGARLLAATTAEYEKELGVKNSLHRKKIELALRYLTSPPDEPATEHVMRLDHIWVLRWLDDIGLAQYKDSFGEAKIDGRMLNFLTVVDLVNLKVTSDLHHASIRRAIQVLRLHDFNPTVLQRRPIHCQIHPSP